MSRYRLPYSLTKRGKYWYYRTYNNQGVRTTAKSTGQTNKNAARAYCEKLHLSGTLWTSEKRFNDYASHFYDDDSVYVKDRIKPLSENTINNYRKFLKNQILPYFEKCKFSDITYTKVKTFRTCLIKNYTLLAVTAIMSCFKHIIDSAYRDGLLNNNPFQYLEPLGSPEKTRDAFTLEEVIFIYNNIGDEFKNTILLMALTGTRISEAVGITIEDVKTSPQGFQYIDLKKQFEHKKYKELKGKDARPIPITPEIINLFGFDNTRLSAFYKAFQPVKNQLKDADERKLSFHSLRHFFITNAKSEGYIESKVEFIAGHKLRNNTRMASVYTNYKPEDLKDVITWQKDKYLKIKAAGCATH